MSFAGIDQIYISRSYYEFVSRLSDEYANLFKYHGALKDKHGANIRFTSWWMHRLL